MLVCNVSLRHFRTIAADIVEAAGAAIDVVGLPLYAVLVDEPAAALDATDAWAGQIMVEAAAAADVVSIDGVYAVAIVEELTAIAAQDIRVPGVVDADIVESMTTTSSEDATIVSASTAWNPGDATNITLSNANLTAAAATNAQAQVRAVASKTTGKYYFEVTCSGTMQNSGVGVSIASPGGSTLVPNSAAFVNVTNGSIFLGGSFTGVGIVALGSGDRACVAVDLANKRIWFRLNNGQWNGSGTANPATNVGGIDITSIAGSPLFPIVTFTGTGLSHTANFGATSFAFAAPSGFTAGWPA